MVHNMSDPVQTTPDGLRNLVRWAHSHGTICSLIPSLQQLTCASHGNVLPPGSGGSSVPVARWGCAAGHSYRWPLSDHGNGCRGSANTSQGPERLVGGRRSNKVTARSSCDLCYNEAASEGEEFSSWPFDNDGCDSSATDEGGDYEPRSSRKRGGTPGRAVTRKKVKQEVTSPEDHDAAVNTASTGPAETDAGYVSQACRAPNTDSQITHTLLPKKALTRGPQPLHGQDLSWERLEDPEMELLAGSSYMTETTGTSAGEQNELENLHVLLRAERSRNQQMTAIISGLKQDKEMLQKELAKKADVICDFLQDKLRPGVDSPTIFDSCEEMELHPLDHYRAPKSKWSRDGENPRVRMKNVGGVIARYMAALEEFRCSVSMKVAFDRVGVDRNTISRTASIAELSMAAPEVFHALAPWDEKGETLAHYAHRCRQAMDDNTKAKIKTMKGKGELLPIVSNRPH